MKDIGTGEKVILSENVLVLSLFTLFGCIFLISFGSESLVHDRATLGTWLIGCAIAVMINYIIYWRHKNQILLRNGVVTIMGLVLLSLIYTGGVANTGPLWLFVMPLVAFYICGLRTGATIILVMFLCSAIILFAPLPWAVTDYTLVFKGRFLGSLLLVALMAFVLEFSRQRAKRQLVDKIQQLEEKERVISRQKAEMETDLLMARELQMAMLPTKIPCFPCNTTPGDLSMHFFHHYLPFGTVGGDFFHIVSLSENKAGVIICDVMGHEVRSALVTAMLRALTESLRHVAENPGLMMTRINDDMCTVLEQVGDVMFTTAMYMVIDRHARTVSYARAGHHEAILMRRSTGKLIKLPDHMDDDQPALGIFKDTEYETLHSDIQSDDMILLFTDGLFEVVDKDNNELDMECILEVITDNMHTKVDDLFELLIKNILTQTKTGTFSDDVCLVGIEIQDETP